MADSLTDINCSVPDALLASMFAYAASTKTPFADVVVNALSRGIRLLDLEETANKKAKTAPSTPPKVLKPTQVRRLPAPKKPVPKTPTKAPLMGMQFLGQTQDANSEPVLDVDYRGYPSSESAKILRQALSVALRRSSDSVFLMCSLFTDQSWGSMSNALKLSLGQRFAYAVRFNGANVRSATHYIIRTMMDNQKSPIYKLVPRATKMRA